MTLFKHGALTSTKWPVYLESTIYVSCGSSSGGVRHYSNIGFFFKRCHPRTSFLVGLTAAHVIRSSGLSFVSFFGKVAAQTCVSVGNFVAMSSAIIVR
jgi:hypothetical protein